MLVDKIFRDDNSCSTAIGCRAAHRSGQKIADWLVRQNFFDSHVISELAVGIVDRVVMILGRCSFVEIG